MIDKLNKKFDIDYNLVKYLYVRGIDNEDKLDRYLNPSIDDLTPIECYKGAFVASRRIIEAIELKERILVYGDYDCDGICSVSILVMFLRAKGAMVDYYIPNRHNDGYGISTDAIDRLVIKYNPSLIISVDCGVSSVNEINYITNKYNIDFIVTDHHMIPDYLPNCIIFNPKLESDAYTQLSGAGVVLRLIEAIDNREEMMKYLDIAAISTIADIVPLTDDNRIITSLGLQMLKSNTRKGLKILFRVASARFVASDIAYKVAPRINASGRLSDANKVVELFLSEDYFLLQSIVREIDQENNKRRQMSDQLYKDVLDDLDDYDLINSRIIILHNKNWDTGILGIAAAKVAREFNRPTILLANEDNYIKGSGRSIKPINLYDCLSDSKELLEAYGGHSQAVGISIKKENIDLLIDSMSNYIDNNNIAIDENNYTINIDTFDNLKIFKDLQRLEPFGHSNEKPSFTTSLKNLQFEPIKNTNHIKSKVTECVEFVAFNSGGILGLYNSGIDGTLKLDLNINRYNGLGQGIINSVRYEVQENDLDYIRAGYIKQLLYPNTNFYYESIDSNSVKQLLSKGFGVLLIASSLNTCYNVFKRYNNLSFDIVTKSKLNPVNRLILNPNSRYVARFYHTIVFVDRPLAGGYANRYIGASDKNVYILDSNDTDNLGVGLNEEKLLDITSSIDSMISKSCNVKSLEELYYRISSIKPYSYLDFAATFYILYEIKYLLVDNEFNIKIANDKLDLNKSAIYRRLNDYR